MVLEKIITSVRIPWSTVFAAYFTPALSSKKLRLVTMDIPEPALSTVVSLLPSIGIELDNRLFSPYNPVLSPNFQTLVNVEFCNSVKAVKYTFKYVKKCFDQVVFTV